MKNVMRWKLLILTALAAYALACAPKRNITQFAKNKEAEAGQTYTEEQLRAALGSDRYDALVVGIGADNLNLLTYGIGVSNMTQLINGITTPGKLPALMSSDADSTKLSAIQVLDLLNKLDSACQARGSFGTDTLQKMVNLLNTVTPVSMKAVKNIVHGVRDQSDDINNGVYDNGIARLAYLISRLDESSSTMPMLINGLAEPTPGVYFAPGAAKLIRLVNLSVDINDLAVIINGTGPTGLPNIIQVMSGLTGNMHCSKAEHQTQTACANASGVWTNSLCSTGSPASPHTDRIACQAAGGSWSPDGIENMSRIINELDKRCSDPSLKTPRDCLDYGLTPTHTWHTKAAKVPVILDNITVVSNMYNIINGLTNDGKRPPWPSGLPDPYLGDAGNIFDGVDSMIATLNAINVQTMGDPASANAIPFGLNGVKRLAYLVNKLDTTGAPENDTNFDDTTAGFNCITGNFNNQMNWAFSDNNRTSGGPSWASQGVTKHLGACALASDGTAASAPTVANPVDNRTQSAELIVNLTAGGNVTFQTNSASLGAGDVVRFFIDDACQNCGSLWSNAQAGWQSHSFALPSGLRRLRWDVHRVPGSAGRFYLDTVALPGTKGAERTAAQKTAIMMNNLYINSSLTNVADLLGQVTATTSPAAGCWSATPMTCTTSNNNGLDALVHVVNRAEYPGGAASTGIASAVTMAGTTVTWPNHNLAIGTAVKFSTSGTLPSPLTTADVYYVASLPAPAANTFALANTPAGAAITLTGGSGSHLAISLPRLAVTVNQIGSITEMKDILDTMTSVDSFQQLVSMMDFIQTPGNIPTLINLLSTGGGAKTAQILSNINAAGTSNMLRILADNGVAISDVADLINGATTTAHVGTILKELPLSANTDIAGVETYFTSTATGGVKLAQFFNRIRTVGTANAQNCSVGPNPVNSNFCIKNHLVRLVNDVAASANGPGTIAAIVGGMRPDTGGPGGVTGVDRMTNVMYYLKTMNSAPLYNDVLATTTADSFGRLNMFIADLGAAGGATTARMVNEVDNLKLTTHVGSLIQNTNRIKYLARFVSELTNIQLIIDIINGSPSIGRVQNLMNDMGNSTANSGNPATKYTNQDDYWATDNDKLGKVITFMNYVTGGSANVVALLNGVTFTSDAVPLKFTVLKDLVKDVHRIRYMTRILNEATSVALIVALINASPDATRFGDLVNDFGDQTVSASFGVATYAGSIYGSNPTGAGCAAMPLFANGKGCDTNTTDKLGKVIVMLNEITAIQNTVDLMIQSEYFAYVKNLLLGVNRIRYLTYIVNNLTNVNLMIKVINGADACTVYKTGVNDDPNPVAATGDNQTNCGTAVGIWSGVGRCVGLPVGNATNEAAAATLTTKAACGTTATRVWIGAEQSKLLSLVNGVGDSEYKGNVNEGDLLGAGVGTKPVGELYVLVDTMNQLGYSGATARSLGQQVRVVRVINQVQYCGLVSTYDKTIQQGPTCVNASNIEQPAYQFREACLASGNLWRAKYNNAGTSAWVDASTMFFDCNDPSYQKPTAGAGPTVYYTDGDRYDGRNRLATTMLGVTDGAAFSVVVGDVQETQKTINMLNGVRRVRALSQFVKWTPGGVTAALINDTHWSAVLRSLIYLANNLEDTEDETAKAFASMVHFGTKIVAQNNTSGAGNATPTPCLEFSGLGPRRLAAVLNLEAGPYLEGVIAGLGWQMSIAAMNCGWAVDAADNQTTCPANAGAGWPTNGGMRKAVGRSYVGLPKPVDVQCVYSKEITAGYSYGNYTWAGSKGISQTNCELLMPETSGAPVPIFGTQQKATDAVIWQGFSPLSGLGGTLQAGIGADNCTGEVCADMWSILKGTGGGTGGIDLIGTLMTQDNSFVGFPPPRVFNDTENCTLGLKGSTSTTTCTNGTRNTVCTGSATYNGNNWQCLRTGLIAGDLEGAGSRGYWGTYCAAGDADRSNLPTGSSNCISRGGKWTTEKNYSGPSCQVDPSAGPSARVGPP